MSVTLRRDVNYLALSLRDGRFGDVLRVLLWAILLTGSACSLPREGPTTRQINHHAAQDEGTDFTLIEINEHVANLLQTDVNEKEAAVKPSTLPLPRAIGLIGPGDLLKVTMWEAIATGATGSERPAVEISVRVEPTGRISLPYIGRLQAAGRTPGQIEADLVSALSAQMVAPQASVLVMDDLTNAVIVQGEVAHPGRQALTPGSNALLDVLALAGGPRIPAEQALVRVERGNNQVTEPLPRILAVRALNLSLGPGDRVVVLPLNRRFYAFGAVNRPGEQVFPSETQTLAQALGRIAGLQDNRADPDGLYVFRSQPAELTRRLMGSAKSDAGTNTVYHLRMDDPNAFFLASEFRVRPEDVIFVSNSPIADLSKVVSLITGIGSIAATPRNITGTP